MKNLQRPIAAAVTFLGRDVSGRCCAVELGWLGTGAVAAVEAVWAPGMQDCRGGGLGGCVGNGESAEADGLRRMKNVQMPRLYVVTFSGSDASGGCDGPVCWRVDGAAWLLGVTLAEAHSGVGTRAAWIGFFSHDVGLHPTLWEDAGARGLRRMKKMEVPIRSRFTSSGTDVIERCDGAAWRRSGRSLREAVGAAGWQEREVSEPHRWRACVLRKDVGSLGGWPGSESE